MSLNVTLVRWSCQLYLMPLRLVSTVWCREIRTFTVTSWNWLVWTFYTVLWNLILPLECSTLLPADIHSSFIVPVALDSTCTKCDSRISKLSWLQARLCSSHPEHQAKCHWHRAYCSLYRATCHWHRACCPSLKCREQILKPWFIPQHERPADANNEATHVGKAPHSCLRILIACVKCVTFWSIRPCQTIR